MHGVVHTPGQPPVVTTTLQPPPPAQYAKKTAKVLGAIQISLGVIAALLHIIDIIVWHSQDRTRTRTSGSGSYVAIYSYNYIGAGTPGIWTGIMFIIAGALAVASSMDASKCKVVSTMVMSIIACVMTWVPMIPLAIALCVAAAVGRALGSPYQVTEVVNGLLILVGGVEFGISMAQAIICCRFLCCGQQSTTTTTTMTTTTMVAYPVSVQGGQVIQNTTLGPHVIQPGQQPLPQMMYPAQLGPAQQQYPTAPPAYTAAPSIGQPQGAPGKDHSDGYLTVVSAPPPDYLTPVPNSPTEEPMYEYINPADVGGGRNYQPLV